MSGFSSEWLEQREPFDAAARRLAAVQLGLQSWLVALARSNESKTSTTAAPPMRIIDLACGTGASLRALAATIANAQPADTVSRQEWLVVDHDEALLATWPDVLGRYAAHQGWQFRYSTTDESSSAALRLSSARLEAHVQRQSIDLAEHVEMLPLQGVTLVTASALLDLVSDAWLQRLVTACASARAAVLMSLTVDGRMSWLPDLPDDEFIDECFSAHQRRDKGFGPALGGRAASAAVAAFAAAGYEVRSARSDWVIDGGDGSAAHAMLSALIDGIASAAMEQRPADVDRIAIWQRRRHSLKSQATLVIGHVDMIAKPRSSARRPRFG